MFLRKQHNNQNLEYPPIFGEDRDKTWRFTAAAAADDDDDDADATDN